MHPEIYLVVTASLLGVRHGLDWDHVAAIIDLAGAENVATTGNPDRAKSAPITVSDGVKLNLRTTALGGYYALGHSASVIAMAIVAACFVGALPSWLDDWTARLVGITLLGFGVWILFSLVASLTGKKEYRYAGRVMLIEAIGRKFHSAWSGFQASVQSPTAQHVHGHGTIALKMDADKLGVRRHTAFGLGVLHGLGAETGTQIAALTAASHAALPNGIYILGGFIGGLIVANCILASAIATGFITVASIQILNTALGVISGVFSIYVGCCLFLGYSLSLPSLEIEGSTAKPAHSFNHQAPGSARNYSWPS